MSGALRFHATGIPEVQERLRELKVAVRKRFLRGAVAKAARLVAKVEKALAPKASGLLKKSIGSKVYSKGNVVGVIGARTGFEQEVDGRKVDPVRTLHFADTGRKAIEAEAGKYLTFRTGKGKNARWVKVIKVAAFAGTQFRARAYHQTRSQVAAIIRADLAERLAKFKGR